jgi:DNA-directed RNA polymerase specialized sigma24 family protein
MTAITDAPRGELPGDADAAIRQLYSRHAEALHGFAERFCPDSASADDIVQESFIRAWRYLPQLTADDRPIRPWLFRVARNLLIDAARADAPYAIPDTATAVLGVLLAVAVLATAGRTGLPGHNTQGPCVIAGGRPDQPDRNGE